MTLQLQTLLKLRLVLALGLLASLSTACVGTPPPLSSETDFLSGLSPKTFKQGLAIAPIRGRYKATEFPADLPAEDDPDFYQPELTDNERAELSRDLRLALIELFGDKVTNLADPSQIVSQELRQVENDCERAEGVDAQLLLDARVVENRMECLGPSLNWTIFELLLFNFYPFHWVMPNERFKLTRTLELSFYDVRNPDPKDPLFRTRVTGSFEAVLSEFEHGIVFFNTWRWIWRRTLNVVGDTKTHPGIRYAGSAWQDVYVDFRPNTNRALQKNVLSNVDQGFRGRLQDRKVQRILEKGDPSKARTFAIVIGQDQSSKDGLGTQYAAVDARDIQAQLAQNSDRSSVRLLTEEVTRDACLTAIKNLRTKEVDKVLFYFAGQGGQDKSTQYLRMSDGPLTIPELASAFESVSASNVLFIFDCSFGGDASRGLNRGRRSDPKTQARAPLGQYLQALQNQKRGYQILAATGPEEATGEYRGHGLLTGFLLKAMARSRRCNLAEATELFAAPLERRSEAWLGRRHRVFLWPATDRQDWVLRRKRASKSSPDKAKKAGKTPKGDASEAKKKAAAKANKRAPS